MMNSNVLNNKLQAVNHKPTKSWIVQLTAAALYVQYLLAPEHITVAQSQDYELGILNFIIQVVVMMALSMAVGALTAQKPPKPRHSPPAGIEQFSVPTAEEGRAIQVLFGKRYIAGPNVVWYGDLKSVPIVVRM